MNDLPITELLPSLTAGERKLLAEWLKHNALGHETTVTVIRMTNGKEINAFMQGYNHAKAVLRTAIDDLIVGAE